MEIPTQYAYFSLVVIFGILWVFFLILFPETRRIQLLISILAIPLGPIIELLYFQDYWHPLSIYEISFGPFRILAEDLAFAFFSTGLTGMFAHVSGKPAANLKLKATKIFLVGIGVASILISIPLLWLGLNSILATSTGFLCVAAVTAIRKEETAKYALRCGLLTSATMFAVYLIGSYLVSNSEDLLRSIWFLYGKPILGIRLLWVPLSEIVWGFSFGAMVGAIRHYLFA